MDFTEMTNEELYELIEDAQTELGRRQTAEQAEQEIAEVVKKHRDSGVINAPVQGDEWCQPPPGEYYTLNDITTRFGRTWRSNLAINVWPPGDESDPQSYRWWTDITEGEPGEGETEDGVRIWSGEGVDYVTDDELDYDGTLYRVLQNHTSQPGWTPDAVPALYQRVV